MQQRSWPKLARRTALTAAGVIAFVAWRRHLGRNLVSLRMIAKEQGATMWSCYRRGRVGRKHAPSRLLERSLEDDWKGAHGAGPA